MLAVNGGNDVQFGWFRLRPPVISGPCPSDAGVRSFRLRRLQTGTRLRYDLTSTEALTRPARRAAFKKALFAFCGAANRPGNRGKCGRLLAWSSRPHWPLVVKALERFPGTGNDALPCWLQAQSNWFGKSNIPHHFLRSHRPITSTCCRGLSKQLRKHQLP